MLDKHFKTSAIFQEADIAITDLTVTSERIKALDFTPAIMNLGKFCERITNSIKNKSIYKKYGWISRFQA